MLRFARLTRWDQEKHWSKHARSEKTQRDVQKVRSWKKRKRRQFKATPCVEWVVKATNAKAGDWG